MKIETTKLEGVFLIRPDVYGDHRGWFSETYNMGKLKEFGLSVQFVQDNHSYSKEKGTLRGIHFQNGPKAQTKLVRCTRGKILDVAVDLRRSSPTFKAWEAFELSASDFRELYIPKGFGHAFLALTADAEVQYKADEFYAPAFDRSIRYNDPDIGVIWPDIPFILSAKDQKAPFLKDSDVQF